jgi:cellulose synthase/poly-beta-1,6-N-acetylglucosamine synthase-like glycosyltransferase
MKIAAIVPAYNEAWNIRRLLYNLLYLQRYGKHKLEIIIVICSGCTDGTDRITKEVARRNSKVYPIIEKRRYGKTHALNKAIKMLQSELKEVETVVFLSSDVIPQRDSIRNLTSALEKPSVGCAISYPVPLNEKTKLNGKLVNILWYLHNEMNYLGWHKVTGEMFAIKSFILKPLPEGIINDDLYIEYLVEQSQLKHVFVPKAKVYMWGPSSMTELFEQRRRIYRGHFQFAKRYKARHMSLTNTLKITSTLISRYYPAEAMIFVLIEGASRLAAHVDSVKGHYEPVWKMIRTSKGGNV